MAHRAHRSTVATRESVPVSHADELFFALDGHIVATDEGDWELRVDGIHEDRGCYWAQITLEGPRRHEATMRFDSNSGDLLTSINRLLNAEPDDRLVSELRTS